MCEFISLIVTRELNILFCESDSHEDIIERAHLTDKKIIDRDFVRIEVLNGDMKRYVVDETKTLPDWYDNNERKIKAKVKKVTKQIIKHYNKYKKVTDSAFAEYKKVRDPAYAEYEKVTDPAFAKYEKVSAPTFAEYKKVKDSAYAEYKKVRDTAFAEHEKVRDAAYAKYKKVKDSAFAEYEKHLKTIEGYCEN